MKKEVTHVVPQSGTRWKRWWLAISLALLTAGIAFAPSRFQPTIHSCDAYFPEKPLALWGLGRALLKYMRQEGFVSFAQTMAQLVSLQIRGFSSPSFYGVESIAGKRVLMVGGGYIRDFLSRAQQAGVHIHLIDNQKLRNRTAAYVEHFFAIEDFGRVSIQDPERFVARSRCSSLIT